MNQDNQFHIAEDVLQILIEKNPDLLSLCEKNNLSEKWLLINREVGIPFSDDKPDSWYLDHLFVNNHGIPALVEVKCSHNAQIRREIIGQMLDYIANATKYWSIETIKREFEKNCYRKGEEPFHKLACFIGQKELDVVAYDAFWDHVYNNFLSSRIRLVFLSDVIPPELQRVIEYLREEFTRIDIRSISLEKYIAANMEMVLKLLQEVRVKNKLRPNYNQLYQIAEKQAGYFSAQQAIEVGYSWERLSSTTKSGRFNRVASGVYRLVHFPGSSFEDLYMAWLLLGENSVISHDSALARYDLSDYLPTAIHIIVPRTASRRRKNIRLHTNQLSPDETTYFEGLRITTVARTIADVASSGLAEEFVKQAIREAFSRELVSRDELFNQAVKRGGRAKKIILSTIRK